MQNLVLPAEPSNSFNKNLYLKGGGEMGQLTRSFDWSKNILGTPENWPQSLLTTLSIILNSKFPMFLWWGPELIQFYNDAYRPSLGQNGKHPKALGQRAEECWPEIWPIIKPLIDQVLADGEAVWSEDQLIPIYRNNTLEDVYWTFGYSKVCDESGKPAGVLVVCNETTEKIKTYQKLAESYEKDHKMNSQLCEVNNQLASANHALKVNINRLAESKSELHHTIDKLAESETRFRELMLRAPVAMVIFNGPDFVIELINNKALEYCGRTAEQLLNLPAFTVLPEAKGQGFEKLLENVFKTGNSYVANEHPVTMKRNGKLETTWLNFIYEPIRDIYGSVSKIMMVFTEVTEQVNARKAIERAEEELRHAVNSAELCTWYINAETREFLPSRGLKELFNYYPDEEMSYDAAINLITAGYREKVLMAIEEAISTDDAFNMEFPIIGFHDKKLRWLRATGKLYPADGNKPEHFSGTMADITERNAKDMQRYEGLKEQLQELQKQEIFRVTIRTQEEERKRIAESLHNGIGQLLYAVKLNLSQIDLKQDNMEYAQFQKAKRTTEELLNEAIRESRRISHELTPQFLEDFGLRESIRDVCRRFGQFMKLKCNFRGSASKLDKYLELSIYRIIQELILNVVKHAQATEANVEIDQGVNYITVVISDNGTGFQVSKSKSKGIGLQGIFNKVKLLNGKYKIESLNGTKVTVQIPVRAADN